MRKKLQNSHSQIFFKKGVLKNFANFTEKYPCWSLFLIKNFLQDFIKKRFQHIYFSVKFAKFLRTPLVATFETKYILQLPFYYILE